MQGPGWFTGANGKVELTPGGQALARTLRAHGWSVLRIAARFELSECTMRRFVSTARRPPKGGTANHAAATQSRASTYRAAAAAATNILRSDNDVTGPQA